MRWLGERWAALVIGHRVKVLALAVLIWTVSGFGVRELRVDTSFAALLRPDTPELVEVNRLLDRVGGAAELVIAVGDGDERARLTFGRVLTETLRRQTWIRGAEVEYPIEFFKNRRLLLLSTGNLRRLDQRVTEAIERATARANPLYVDLEEDAERPPWTAVDDAAALAAGGELLRRTFTSRDGRYLLVRVKPIGTTYEMKRGSVLLARIKAAVAAADPARHGVTVRYAGSLALNQEQHRRMTADFRRASLIAAGLILLLLTLYIRRLVAPLVIALPLAGGVLTTLALTTLVIGQLNLVSGFLVSALFGLGVDFAIHLYLRYLWQLEAGLSPTAAMRDAVVETLPPCVIGALTTAGAFFAMASVGFRGFREYGLIAGGGVLITLVMTFAVLPPLALLLSGKPRRAARAPIVRPPRRWLLWGMIVAGAGLLALSVTLAPRVRWHNDFRELRGISEAADFSLEVGEVLGGDLSPAAIYVEDAQQVRQVTQYLARLKREPGSPVRAHLALTQMVPRDVKAKKPILDGLRRRIERVLKRNLQPADRRRIEQLLALTRVAPWTIEEVPEVFRRPLSTLDGRGQLVAVWPRHHTDIDTEIIAWADVLSRIRRDLRSQGIPAAIMDENRIAARVLTEMRQDVPVVLVSAAAAVLLVLALHFRRPRHVLVVAGSVAVGLVWTLGLLGLWRVDLNVFNQAVLATILGVGVDNAVHIYHRYLHEGAEALPGVLATTGVAALLASVTTTIGFGTAVTAHHLGVRSFGWLAIAGLASVFVAATVLLPTLLITRGGSEAAGGAAIPRSRSDD